MAGAAHGLARGAALLAVLSVLSWLLIFFKVHEPKIASDSQPKPGFIEALQGFGSLLLLPHTWGIVLLGMVSYASFLTVRPCLLMDRYQFSLVTTGNVALASSIISLFVPSMFGRPDPGPACASASHALRCSWRLLLLVWLWFTTRYGAWFCSWS